jgi:hypothetical protein
MGICDKASPQVYASMWTMWGKAYFFILVQHNVELWLSLHEQYLNLNPNPLNEYYFISPLEPKFNVMLIPADFAQPISWEPMLNTALIPAHFVYI